MGGYDQLCCPASPTLLFGLDLGLGCDKMACLVLKSFYFYFGILNKVRILLFEQFNVKLKIAQLF